MRRRTPAILIAALVSAGLPRLASANAAGTSGLLSPAEQLTIARAFAPVLVYHPDEQYLPIGSLFPLRLDEPSEPRAMDGSSVSGGLASVGDRVAQYEALPRDAKLALASVGYRVFSRVDRGETEVIVEYWCHYVYNEYTVRLGWLPYRIRDNHPEDLERLYVVLVQVPAHESPDGPDELWARRAFHVRLVVANAHDGSIPPNEYDVGGSPAIALPLTILVERGSHAMAPDIDHDGRFTPGIDSTGTRKLLWGIRDGGKAWGWYRASYMDTRDDTAVRLCAEPGAVDLLEPPCFGYALYPVDDLQRWFERLQLSERDRLEIVGHSSWVARVFGDVRVEDLTVPNDPADGRVLDRMLNRRTRTQDGIVLGFTTMAHAPTIIAGKRFFWDVTSRRMPDVMADAVALFPNGRPTAVHATLTASYALDATTNIIAGGGWFSNSTTKEDAVVGFDIRVGRFHVRPTRGFRQHGYHATLVALF